MLYFLLSFILNTLSVLWDAIISIFTIGSERASSAATYFVSPALHHRDLSPYLLSTRRMGFRRILVLDLDETLVHSSVRPYIMSKPKPGLDGRIIGRKTRVKHDFQVEITIKRKPCVFYIFKRPHVDRFLQQVSLWYDIAVYTASLKAYANPLVDRLNYTSNCIRKRYFRESCVEFEGNLVKDLNKLTVSLSDVIIIDNSPESYSFHQENGLPIKEWNGSDLSDHSLLDLLPILDALQYTRDVRSVLGLRVRA